MNPHAPQPLSLNSLIVSLWRNRQIIVQMTKREVLGRYKGSAMGLLWSFFNPIFMLMMYMTRWPRAHAQTRQKCQPLIF